MRASVFMVAVGIRVSVFKAAIGIKHQYSDWPSASAFWKALAIGHQYSAQPRHQYSARPRHQYSARPRHRYEDIGIHVGIKASVFMVAISIMASVLRNSVSIRKGHQHWH